ncbi:hypothetical protein BKA62DRAFT_635475 [Auriculariales sp. MPI-PUGE-AT-0066]|nr:hypothetical protein BKA62DRAFT_635475 [Auriculariales sp. MPI-PUGE-AT-0066]
MDPSASDDPWANVDRLLETYKPLIRQFLLGNVSHPKWAVPHEYKGEPIKTDEHRRLEQLGFLTFGDRSRPDMLLYKLGQLDDLDATFADRYEKFTARNEHTVLVNTSGTGKTRLLFETLTRVWGFYLTCEQNRISPYGSSDLPTVLKTAIQDELTGPPDSWHEQHEMNKMYVRQDCNLLLLARLLVFQVFCDLVQSHHIDEKTARRQWLILQLRSDIIFEPPDSDIFSRLFARASTVDSALVEARLPIVLASCAYRPEIVAVDEANVASKMHLTSFVLSDGTTLAPILREVVFCLSSALPRQRIVVAGTRVDINIVRDGLQAGSSNLPNTFSFCALGFFDTVNSTQAYLRHFFPSISEELVLRAHGWFQGRHRFLANFVENMLIFGFQRVNAYIHMAVASLTGYEPDGAKWELERNYGLLRGNDELSDSCEPVTLRDALFAYALRGQQSRLWTNVSQHVWLGLAVMDDDTNSASVWEPLVFYRVLTWLRTYPESCSIDTLLQRPLTAELPMKVGTLSLVAGLAAYIYQLHAPRGGKRLPVLSEYLTFEGAAPRWASSRAEIVLPPLGLDDATSLRYPHSHSVLASRGPDEVQKWIRGGNNPFLIPEDDMGVDLMYFLRLTGDGLGTTPFVLVTLQIDKSKREARRHIILVPSDPSNLRARTKKDHNVVFTALKKLPKLPTGPGDRPSQQHPMLRILCFASPYQLGTVKKRKLPVAVLRPEALLPWKHEHEHELDASNLERMQKRERGQLGVVDVRSA